MYILNVSVLFIYIFNILGCSNDNCIRLDKANATAINSFNKGDSFLRDFPKDKFGGSSPIYTGVKELYGKLGLEKIDSGYNYFKIRIEADFDKKKKGSKILSITFKNNEWEGMFYKASNPQNDTSFEKVLIDSIKISPKIGWCNFIDKLFSLDILNLPNINETVGDSIVVADGGYVFFEIGAKNRYRFYYYYTPEILATTKFREGDCVIEIFKLIHENFSF